MKRKSNELIDIDGKKYTRYDCTQLQRQIETKIRKLKDRKELFKAAGDDVGVRECNRKIRLLKEKYNEITQKAGLNAHYDRMSVVKSGKTVDFTAKSGIIKSGAKSGAKKTEGWQDRHADRMYEEIRHRSTDAAAIAQNTVFTEKAATEIKQHMFIKEHRFADGSIKRFDSDFEQAQAWDRLTQGNGSKSDLVLLKHEYVELTLMRLYNYDYETAHEIANKHHNWAKIIVEEASK